MASQDSSWSTTARGQAQAPVSGPYRSHPTASTGYYRGGGSEIPLAQGQGSGMGPANQGIGLFRQGEGPSGAGKGWSPTVTYLIVLTVAEVVAMCVIGRALERWGML